MKLTVTEIAQVTNRARHRWLDLRAKYPAGTQWREYWKVNARSYFQNARMFKGMMSREKFFRYLADYQLDPWKLVD